MKGEILVRKLLATKEEKVQFIINHLLKMKGLEFINSDEINACNLAIRRLRSTLPKENK
jgi:hypothetical protein